MLTKQDITYVAGQARILHNELTAAMPSGTDVTAMVAAAMPALINTINTPSLRPPR
jgi:hypothetical protein